MCRIRRATTVTGVLLGFSFALAGPALADGWGNVNCGDAGNPSCDLNAGRDGNKVLPPGSKPVPQQSPERGGEQHSTPLPGDRIIGGPSNLAECSYVRSNYQPPTNGVQTAAFRPHASGSTSLQLVTLSRQTGGIVLAQAPGKGGAWYVYQCSGPGFRDSLYRAPVWIADGQAPGASTRPSPEDLAQQARSQLRMPSPRIVSNPTETQLVTLPTWLWLERDSWGPQSATASVPGVSVTAVATPTSVSWSMGDGTELTCTGPGTPFPPGGNPDAASPDCGHTYHRSSARAPGGAFPVSATVHWTVTWSGAGTGGTFPDMTTNASASFRVAEAQALGIGNR
jgi:hypothetical protein